MARSLFGELCFYGGERGNVAMISETVVVLAIGTVVLAILFGARIAIRAVGGATQDGGAASGRDGRSPTDVPGVVALPPFIFLGFLVAATVLEAVIPLPVLTAHAVARYVVGAVFIVSGFVMIGLGTRRFLAAGTNIPPNLPTTALVVDGVYGRTRNPLYLGSTLVYLGLSIAAGSLWAIMLVMPLLWVISAGVIAREERYLERKFGNAYRVYKARVRRWM
jgi:protein-S-isoprenylcysteine O-methyltransferase Ste14